MRRRKPINSVIIYVIAIAIAMMYLGPYLWMIMTSVKSQADVMAWPPKILPSSFHWKNYITVFQTTLLRALFNSAVVAFSAMSINVFVSSLAAFGFARLKFPGKKFFFMVVMATMMIPAGLMVVPLFTMMKNMPFGGANGWLDTYQGLILPFAVTGFGIFYMRQYYLSIPMELDEQATIDGCNKFQIYWKIILPLSKPAASLVAVFTFLQRWNDYLWSLTVARSDKMYTIQIALKSFQTQYNINWPLLMTGATIAVVPTIILYFSLQSTFEKALGGVGNGLKE